MTGSDAHGCDRRTRVAFGQLVSFLQGSLGGSEFSVCGLDDRQGAQPIRLDQHIAGLPALFDPDLQVMGGGVQVIPLVHQRPQLDMGGRNRRGSCSQLDHLTAQLGRPPQPAVNTLDHPQVGQGSHASIKVVRALGGLIDLQEGLLGPLKIALVPVGQAKGERHQAARERVGLR